MADETDEVADSINRELFALAAEDFGPEGAEDFFTRLMLFFDMTRAGADYSMEEAFKDSPWEETFKGIGKRDPAGE